MRYKCKYCDYVLEFDYFGQSVTNTILKHDKTHPENSYGDCEYKGDPPK